MVNTDVTGRQYDAVEDNDIVLDEFHYQSNSYNPDVLLADVAPEEDNPKSDQAAAKLAPGIANEIADSQLPSAENQHTTTSDTAGTLASVTANNFADGQAPVTTNDNGSSIQSPGATNAAATGIRHFGALRLRPQESTAEATTVLVSSRSAGRTTGYPGSSQCFLSRCPAESQTETYWTHEDGSEESIEGGKQAIGFLQRTDIMHDFGELRSRWHRHTLPKSRPGLLGT